ncbi:MAG: hypothetical protein ACLRH2_10405, partial [Faecalibacterium prausnitzii]
SLNVRNIGNPFLIWMLGIECRRIVKQRALFCGQGMTVRYMVRNDFLDSFRRMRRVDLADSGYCSPFLSRW